MAIKEKYKQQRTETKKDNKQKGGGKEKYEKLNVIKGEKKTRMGQIKQQNQKVRVQSN